MHLNIHVYTPFQEILDLALSYVAVFYLIKDCYQAVLFLSSLVFSFI